MDPTENMDTSDGSDSSDSSDAMGSMDDMMSEELQKGQSSTVPKDTLAGISLINTLKSGGGMSRDEYNKSISGELGEIAQRKADLYKKLQTGEGLTSSQAVGLGVLALGLMAAGAAGRGKRGIGMAGNAFGFGGGIALKQIDEKNKENKAVQLMALKDLDSQETSLKKEGVQSLMAPIKDEEIINRSVEIAKRKKAAGVGEGISVAFNVPGKVGTQETQLMAKPMPVINEAMSIAQELKKLPSESLGDRAWWAAAKQSPSTPEGKLYVRVLDVANTLMKADKPGSISDWEGKTGIKLRAGDIISSPADVAKLLEQKAGTLAASTAAYMDTRKNLTEDYAGTMDKYKSIAQQMGIKSAPATNFLNLAKEDDSGAGADTSAPKKYFKVNGQPKALTQQEFEDLNSQGLVSAY